MIRATYISINSSICILRAALDTDMNKMDKIPCPCGAYVFMRKKLSKTIKLILAINAMNK